ncbi:MAG TPA: hypothetical protein PKC23_01355 [Candidatus Desulfobacillus sp.]|nr:hypothetical protein [Candidatus Desulfobacillus sp.]
MAAPYLQIALLAAIAWLARRALFRIGPSPVASGAIVMAAGIFGLASLDRIPLLPAAFLTTFALALLLLWAFIAASYFSIWRQGRLPGLVAAPNDGFAVGTWVAGTAVMARLLLIGVPEWRAAVVVLALLACALWLWYLAIVLRGFRAVLASPARLRVTGRILLSTVSTQSLVLLAWDLWPDADWLRVPATLLLVLGYLFYGAGLLLVVQRYLRETGWTLSEDWDNTNCILHGAMSITGLAVAATDLLPAWVGLATWLYVLAMLVLVEAVEIARMARRARLHGLRKGVFTYHVSQWSRNFTFGMFYAFTLVMAGAYAQSPLVAALEPLLAPLIAGGPCVVLFFLLLEAGLWAGAHSRCGALPAVPQPLAINEYAKEQRQ